MPIPSPANETARSRLVDAWKDEREEKISNHVSRWHRNWSGRAFERDLHAKVFLFRSVVTGPSVVYYCLQESTNIGDGYR